MGSHSGLYTVRANCLSYLRCPCYNPGRPGDPLSVCMSLSPLQ